MNDRMLKSMLRQADESAAAPSIAQAIAARVKARAARKAAVGRSAAGMGLGLAIVVMFFLIQHSWPRSKPAAPNMILGTAGATEAAPREMAALSAEANLQEKTIVALLGAEVRVRQETLAAGFQAQPDALEVITEGRNRAAQIMIDRGDRLAKTVGDARDASEAYRRVLELFPESRAAAVAAQRLAQTKESI